MTAFYRGLAVIAVLYALLIVTVWSVTVRDAGAGEYRVPHNAPVSAEALSAKMQEIIGWIEHNSDYEDITPPPVLFLDPLELRYIASDPQHPVVRNDVLAVYNDRIVFLPDSFELGRDDFMLLHEMVHHAQELSGRKYACMAEREREAYELQNQYVEKTGRGNKPGALFIAALRCGYR